MAKTRVSEYLYWRGKKDTDLLEDYATERLQQYRANAFTTQVMSIGHGKGERNSALVRLFKSELERRGVDVDESIEGKFNGEGTT